MAPWVTFLLCAVLELLAAVIYRLQWEHRFVSIVAPVPLVLIVASTATLGMNVWEIEAAFYVFFPAHF